MMKNFGDFTCQLKIYGIRRLQSVGNIEGIKNSDS